jgi:outer membrane protein OmpA-like peptidoglycan-associated protein
MKNWLFLISCCTALNGFSQNFEQSVLFGMDEYKLASLPTDCRKMIEEHIWWKDNQLNGKIELLGYADCVGDTAYNRWISAQRCLVVQNALEEYGVPTKDIVCKPMGEQPCSGNLETKLGDANHRKVLIKLTLQSKEGDIGVLKAGEKLELKGVNFQPGRHFILPESRPQLEALLVKVKANPQIRFEIQGHICCAGKSAEDGQDIDTGDFALSHNRAKQVFDYLLQNGVDASRMRVKGYGNRIPKVWPELTEEDRIMNRRVELMIIE